MNEQEQRQYLSFTEYCEINDCSLIKLFDIGIDAINDIQEVVGAIEKGKTRYVIVDWNHKTGLCSHILSRFWAISKIIKNRGGNLLAINIGDEPRRCMNLTGELNALFLEFDNIENANEYCRNNR